MPPKWGGHERAPAPRPRGAAAVAAHAGRARRRSPRDPPPPAARLRRHAGRFDLHGAAASPARGVKMSELSSRLMVTGGNVTGLTDELQRDGLVCAPATRPTAARDRPPDAEGRRSFGRWRARTRSGSSSCSRLDPRAHRPAARAFGELRLAPAFRSNDPREGWRRHPPSRPHRPGRRRQPPSARRLPRHALPLAGDGGVATITLDRRRAQEPADLDPTPSWRPLRAALRTQTTCTRCRHRRRGNFLAPGGGDRAEDHRPLVQFPHPSC